MLTIMEAEEAENFENADDQEGAFEVRTYSNLQLNNLHGPMFLGWLR